MSPRDRQEWLAVWLNLGADLLAKAEEKGHDPRDFRPQDLFELMLGYQYLEDAHNELA